MMRLILAFGPQYRGFLTITSRSPSVHDWNLYGPVPIGCLVAKLPAGLKTPFESTTPLFAPYFFSAAGLMIAKFRRAPLADGVLETAEDLLPVVGRVDGLERSLEVVPAVEVVTNRTGIERGVVVEPDAAAELERPDAAALRRLPPTGERGDGDRRARFLIDEALCDLVEHSQRRPVRDERAVERHRIALCAEDQRRLRRDRSRRRRSRHRKRDARE